MNADGGQQVIALYKLVKGIGELVLALVLVVLLATGAAHASTLAHSLRRHFSLAWSIRLGALLTPRHIELTALALLFDGLLAMLEGWSLRRALWWGPWLVVVATSSVVPFEVVAIMAHLRWTRILMLIINVLIVVYLAWKAMAEHRARRHRDAG